MGGVYHTWYSAITPVLFADIVLVVVGTLSILALITMLGSLWVWVPYVPTPRKVVERMTELADLKGTETIYDLGCGDARILLAAKKHAPGIRAIGYELPLGIYLLAKIKVWLARRSLGKSGSIEIRMRDFLKADLRDANVIFLYLLPEMYRALERKFQAELSPGTKVISHGFPFPGRKEQHVERVPLPSWGIFSASGKKGPRIFVYEF